MLRAPVWIMLCSCPIQALDLPSASLRGGSIDSKCPLKCHLSNHPPPCCPPSNLPPPNKAEESPFISTEPWDSSLGLSPGQGEDWIPLFLPEAVRFLNSLDPHSA